MSGIQEEKAFEDEHGCGRRLSEPRHDRRLDTLSLPARVTSWAERKGIETLLEIVRLHPAELLAERNIGRTSLRRLRELIRAEYGAEWVELWRELSPPAEAVAPPEPVAPPDLGDAGWDLLASALPEWLLATTLSQLDLPTRMRKFAERSGLRTVADLVAVSRETLLATSNLGRTSLRNTRAILVRHARSEPASSAVPPWEALAGALPDWLLATELTTIELPGALRASAWGRKLSTVAELVEVPPWVFAAAKGVGPALVEEARRSLVALAASRPRTIAGYASFWALWLDALDALNDRERMIAVERSGMVGPTRQLREIGKAMGLSHERVRQIEIRAITKLAGWARGREVGARLAGLLVGGVLELDALGEADPWFRMSEEQRAVFAYFLERIAGGELSLAKLDGRVLVVACAADEIGPSVARARAALRALGCPADAEAVAAAIAEATPPSAPGLAPFIGEALEGRIHRDEHGRMLTFGRERGAEVLGFLSRCPKPVRIHELDAAIGVCRPLPDEVFHFASGVVGLEQHFPDYSTWKERLIPICVRVMETDARQWRVEDLLEALRENVLLPEWFGRWNLAEILRRSPEVRYLNRLRVTLPGVKDQERVKLAALAAQILVEHGAPLAYQELLRRVSRQTRVSTSTFRLELLGSPFVSVDEERIGLMARDVPGGAGAIARFSDALMDELTRTQRGLGAGRLRALLARLGGVHARWSVPMARGVARVDPRFQLPVGRGGGVGLAAWEGARVPTRGAVIRECVEEHGGRVPVRVVLDRLYAEHGTRLGRVQLVPGLYKNGLRMRGEEIMLSEPAEAPVRARRVPRVTQHRGVRVATLLEQPLEGERALLRALDEHAAKLERAEAEGTLADAAALTSLRERCRALLTRSRQRGPRERRLAQAATRYFLLRDDAGLDAGRLDDDDAVIRAVELHLACASAAAAGRPE